MNNKQLRPESPVISTMASGERADAWHWRSADVSQFSSEKLHNILNLPFNQSSKEDLSALKRVREELEKRSATLLKKPT